MSRYTNHILHNNEDLLISWGYDEPMSEYFIQIESMDNTNEDGEVNMLLWVGSYTVIVPELNGKKSYTNSELLELIESDSRLNKVIPKEHKDAIALDLPF